MRFEMLTFILVSCVLTLPTSSVGAHECSNSFRHFPSGENKPLQAVMRRFRDSFNFADGVVSEGHRKPDSVLDEALEEALDHLRTCERLAQKMVEQSPGKMMPPKIDSIPQEDQEEFLKRYEETNREFLRLVVAYKEALEEQLDLAPAERDFSVAYERHFEVREYANWAHRKF